MLHIAVEENAKTNFREPRLDPLNKAEHFEKSWTGADI